MPRALPISIYTSFLAFENSDQWSSPFKKSEQNNLPLSAREYGALAALKIVIWNAVLCAEDEPTDEPGRNHENTKARKDDLGEKDEPPRYAASG